MPMHNRVPLFAVWQKLDKTGFRVEHTRINLAGVPQLDAPEFHRSGEGSHWTGSTHDASKQEP